jgi:tetratricopeptide (TPR) repeat protein
MRALAFDQSNQPDSAIAEFERYLTFRDPFFVQNRDWHAPSHKRLGELYEAKGNIPKALEHYRAFVEQWKSADAELQPQVADVQARLLKLTPVEGTRKP